MNRLVYIFIVLLLPAIKAAATVKLHSLFSDLSSTYKCNFLGADNKQ